MSALVANRVRCLCKKEAGCKKHEYDPKNVSTHHCDRCCKSNIPKLNQATPLFKCDNCRGNVYERCRMCRGNDARHCHRCHDSVDRFHQRRISLCRTNNAHT